MAVLVTRNSKLHTLNRAILNTAIGDVCRTVLVLQGRDSSVGIATRYGLEGPGIESRWVANFSAPVQTGLGAHLASYTMRTGSFPGVKRSGRSVDHPPHLAPSLKKE